MKELLIKIRDYYVEHLEVVIGMRNADKIIDYLDDKDLDLGVCCVAREVFHSNDMLEMVKPYLPKKSFYWCAIPAYCTTKEQIIKSMETRISILNKIIETDCN